MRRCSSARSPAHFSTASSRRISWSSSERARLRSSRGRTPKNSEHGWRILARGNLGEERPRRRPPLMVRLHLFVEGQTEQTFADTVLKPHLANFDVFMQKPVLIAHAHKKGKVHRGAKKFPGDAERYPDPTQGGSGNDVFFTTMIDLYDLPANFPGIEEAENYAISLMNAWRSSKSPGLTRPKTSASSPSFSCMNSRLICFATFPGSISSLMMWIPRYPLCGK